MTLFSSLQIGANTLRADQIGLQVIGQNIANANTEGYIREELILTPAASQQVGKLTLGLGVEVLAVVQKIDNALEERLRNATSEESCAATEEEAYAQLESVIGELNSTDLSTSMNNFFDSISEIMNQPESVSVRNLAVLQGETLTQQINQMARSVTKMQQDVNDRIITAADDINRLVEDIRTLNVRIAETEGGSVSASDAVGLRDQRLQALTALSEIIEIQTVEQPSGTVSVYCGGDYLVIDGTARAVEVASSSADGIEKSEVRICETQMALDTSSGQLRGFTDARDQIYGGFLDDLNDFAATLANEFNKVYSCGQGLSGYSTATSEFAVDDADAALDQTGLTFTPVNGSFQVLVYDKKTATTTTTDIRVKLTGLGDDTTLNSLAKQLEDVDGLSATPSETGKLTIASTASDQTFSFANDTSGVLAALGINTFFTGSTALNIGVSQAVQADPAKFAASQGGLGMDTNNAAEMAAFLDRPLPSKNDSTVGVLYDQMVAEVTQASSAAQATAEGATVFRSTLNAQKMATSGVSLDEEAVNMLTYQRSFQAASRYIQTINELLDILVSL